MTWLKKTNPDWNPQEHPGIIVGDVVDFPGNVQRLVEEGSAVLCDEQGNTISTYDTLGVMTEQEMAEFRAWRENERQEALKNSLESERETLLAKAQEIKAQVAAQNAPVAQPAPTGTVEEAQVELEQKKKEWGAKMAAARAAKRAAEAAPVTEAQVSA